MRVTFVIATYRRAEALRSTIRSVLLQTHGDWTALVIGDRCGDETADVLRPFKDPRIRYYNLPDRFGEQSGPNSAGLHLASGDFIAFLNHDDLLVQDHLAHMHERLGADAADFCFGRFANATRLRETPDRSVVPVFTDVGPHERDLGMLLRANPWLFDPSSFWVIRTPYAKTVGPWRSARSLRRTPLRDWLLRAWRLGGRFCFGTRVTGLRFLTRTEPAGAPVYATATPEHESMADRLERETPDAIRAFVRAQLRQEIGADSARLPREDDRERSPWQQALLSCRRRLLSALYLSFGVDPAALVGRLGRSEGALLDQLSRKRTGEPLPSEPTLTAFLLDPEAYRVL
jgi:hypothetical protein